MSKGAIGVEPYWPQGVMRYLAPPVIPPEEAFVRRPLSRAGKSVALREGDRALTYGELASEVEARAALVPSLLGEGQRLALVLSSRMEEALWLLAALWARCHVYPVDPSLPPSDVQRSLQRFQPDVVLVEEGAWVPLLEPWQSACVLVDQLRPEGRAQRRPGEAFLYLAGEGGALFRFSSRALLAMAVSWSAYLDVKGVVLQVEPLGTWEGLCTLLSALFRASQILQADVANGRLEMLREMEAYYSVVRWDWAQYLAEGLPRGRIGAVYLSVREPPPPRQFRRLANLLYPSLALLVFGLPEIGPAVAHHPGWFLEDSIGLPITNVDLWPLNPETGEPLDLSWEALEYGEMGVKSPMVASGALPEEAWGERVRGEWIRTHRLAQSDANGFLYLLPHRVRASGS